MKTQETASEAMHYLLQYVTASDYLDRRERYRQEHLTLAWEAVERGELVLGGAVGDPITGALLVFSGDSPGIAERFAAADPYVRHGLVTQWTVQPWLTVAGTAPAANPVRPERP
jgi:uncharacterized protein YciI